VGFSFSGKNKHMRNNRIKLNPKFALETRFELRPTPVGTFRAIEETELERLKSRLLRNALEGNAQDELNAPLRQAANEAVSLAWTTPYPLLILPTLFEEKAREARIRVGKQRSVKARSEALLQIA
jgi:hypothetical protein